MTLVDEDVRDPATVSPRRRRRRWIAALSIIVVAALAVVGIVLVHAYRENGKYGPFRIGNSGGVLATSGNVAQQSARHYVLPDDPDAYVQLIVLLDNSGSRATRVDSVSGEDGVTRVDWSRFRDNGVTIGADTAWRSFPAVVPAHGTIRLRLTVHRLAACAGRTPDPGVGGFVDDLLHVHWTSPLGSHTTTVGDGLNRSDTVQIC